MLVTGRLGRSQPWWLIVGVSHLLLLFAIASAAPVDDRNEIQLASDDDLSHQEPSFRLYQNALGDSSSGRSSFQQTPSEFASYAPASRGPQIFKTTLRDTHPTRWERILARFRKSAMLNYGQWRMSMQAADIRAWQRQEHARQKAEARRLAKLAPKPGEVEFQPVYKLSEEELKTARQSKASHDARVWHGENDQLSLDQRKTQNLQVAQTAPRSPSQPRDFQRTGDYQQLFPPDVSAQDSASRPQQEKARRKLSRIPSSEMDAAMLERKARMAAEYGAPDLTDALHRVPLPTLHKRAPPSSSSKYTELPSLRYQGQGWQMVRGTDGREIRFVPYEPHRDIPLISRSFGELTRQEQKSVSKTIPLVEELRKNPNPWNLEGLDYNPEFGAYVGDRDRGMYYFKDRMPQTIGVRSVNGQHQRYQFEYLSKSLWGQARRRWATFEELPDHLKQFLRWQSRLGLDYPWSGAVRFRKRSLLSSSDPDIAKPAQLRKMTQQHRLRASLGKRTLHGSPSSAGTSARSDRFQTFTYPGEWIEVSRTPSGLQFSFQWAQGMPGRVQYSTWEYLSPEAKRKVEQAIPSIHAYLSDPEEARRGGFAFDPAKDPHELQSSFHQPGGPITVHVERKSQRGHLFGMLGRKKDKVVFHVYNPEAGGYEAMDLKTLPTNLREFFANEHPLLFSEAMSSMRLHKRNDPAGHTFLRLVGYPGKKIVLTRLEGNNDSPYRFHFLDETGTRTTKSSKWSSLSQTVQEGLDRQSGEIGYVASTALSVHQGSQFGVRIGEHPFDLNAAYFHPEYPSESIKILRNPRGQVVFQRGAADPIRYSEMPSHLISYLEDQQSVQTFMSEAERAARSLRKRSLETRAPPTHVAFVRYPGKKIVITLLEDDHESIFRFHLLHEDGKTVYKTGSWSSLSSDIRDGLKAQEPTIGSVVKSRLSKEAARQQGVKIGEDAFDLANAYTHPEFPARDIRISPTRDGKIVFEVDRSRPVEFSDLPPHLRVFVIGDGNLDMVVRAAADEAGHRLHKRATGAEAQPLGRRAGSGDDADEARKAVESGPASEDVGPGAGAFRLSDGKVTDTPGSGPTSTPRGGGRSELFRQFGPSGRPYKLLDDSQLYFEDHHYGGEGFRVLRNKDGYRFARFHGTEDQAATFEPFSDLPASDQNELRTLLPGVDQMVVRGPTFEQLQLLGKSGDFGAVYLDGKEPEQIWVTQQERGITYHRFDKKRAPLNNGETNAWSFEELPDHLQRFFDDVKPHA